MNLHAIASKNYPNKWLDNDIWEQAIYYELSSNNLFWNSAHIIILSASATTSADEALLYLLQSQDKAMGIWERQWRNKIPTIQEFLTFFCEEKGFNNTKGNIINPNKFWEKYTANIVGLLGEPDVEFTRNGSSLPYEELLQQNDILQVVCFDDEWNEQNFFIETNEEWILFHWNDGG